MKKIYPFFLLAFFSLPLFSQNVGIGETAPLSKLAVKGSVAVGSSYTTTAAPTDGAIIQGNVGIGTPSPNTKLEISGSSVRISNSGDAKYEFWGSSSDRGFVGWQAGAPVGVYLLNKDNSPIFFGTTNAERMRIDDAGNVGIGTTNTANNRLSVISGSQVQSSVYTDGYGEDVSGIIQGNYVPSHTWNIASGTVGIFADNGGASDNVREWGTGPHGNNVILWKCQGAGNDADGGWNTTAFKIDHTKTYRVSVWVKRTGVNGTGYAYMGCSGSDVTYLNGTDETNPYFFYSTTLPQLDRWYLVVGYIHGSGDASTVQTGGVYDGVTGQKVVTFNGNNGSTDFKFKPTATTQYHRAYLYYNNNSNAKQYFWAPKFEEVNGKELPLNALLAISPDNAGRRDFRPYGTPSFYWDGSTGACATAQPYMSLRGAANYTNVDYCASTWNQKRMFRVTNLSQEAQTNNTPPANGLYLTLPATPNVINTLLLSFIDQDRWSSVSVWLCNSAGSPITKLNRMANNANNNSGTASTYTLSPLNTMKETGGHAWMDFPVTVAQVTSYISGGNLKFLITSGPNNGEGSQLWFSGFALVPNPYGFMQQPALSLHWALNGQTYQEVTWNSVWNNDGLCQVNANSTVTTYIKVIDPTRDLLVTFYEHNGGWYGGYLTVTVGSDATPYYTTPAISGGIGATIYGKAQYMRPECIIIPASVVQAQLLASNNSGTPNLLKLTLKNVGQNNYHFRGIDTEFY